MVEDKEPGQISRDQVFSAEFWLISLVGFLLKLDNIERPKFEALLLKSSEEPDQRVWSSLESLSQEKRKKIMES